MSQIADYGANPLGLPIGCQTYPVRQLIADDFAATLAKLAAIGYQQIEMCSPAGYATQGFGALTKYTGAELQRIITDQGLTCDSSHFMMREMRENQAAALAWAHDAGIKYVIVATLGGPQTPTIDDVKRAAEEYNNIAARTAKAGMVQGLHNEAFEMTTVDGQRTYDLLLDLLDPALVTFQFQVSAIRNGFAAAEYFMRYPGRFSSMHVQGWDATTRSIAAVGQDSLDWPQIFTAGSIGGLRDYYVEMNLDLMQASVPYLKSLRRQRFASRTS